MQSLKVALSQHFPKLSEQCRLDFKNPSCFIAEHVSSVSTDNIKKTLVGRKSSTRYSF
eukprot:c16501_g1_i1 orf=44-217(+)